MEQQKKAKKNKLFDFDEGEQERFHQAMSKIIHQFETPSEVLEGVQQYIQDEGLEEKRAVQMLLISTTLVMNQTFMILHNDLADINSRNPTAHFNLVDAYISQLCILMWSYNFRDIKFDPKTSKHRDTAFLNYLTENYKSIFTMVSKWISLWFYGATFGHLMTKIYVDAIDMTFREIDCSLELIIMSYFYALHDLVMVRKVSLDSFRSLAHFEEILRPAAEAKQEAEKESFEFDGKTFKITNQNKH